MLLLCTLLLLTPASSLFCNYCLEVSSIGATADNDRLAAFEQGGFLKF